MPYGEADIRDETHLLRSLAQLVLDHIDVQRWLFKVDDHFDGLGIAYCDILQHLSCCSAIRAERIQWPDRKAQVRRSPFGISGRSEHVSRTIPI